MSNPYPDQVFIPMAGSIRFEQGKAFWNQVHQVRCTICSNAMDEGWALCWQDGTMAHLHCREEKLDEEKKVTNDPWLSEQSAKRMGLTIEGFNGLPSWERFAENLKAKEERKCQSD